MSAHHETRSDTRVSWLLAALLLGSVWGATEALLGGLLHRALPPGMPGRIMLVVAVALLAYGYRFTRRAWTPLAMALVAAPLKLVAAPVYALPVLAPEVLNPSLAILAQGLGFAAVCPLLARRREASLVGLAVAGAGAGALQAVLWIGLVHWPGAALVPPEAVLADLGAKLPPPWVGSASAVAAVLRSSLPVAAVAGAIGAALAGLVPLAGFAMIRPRTAAALTALCLAISLAAPWLL